MPDLQHRALKLRLDVNNVQAGYLAGCAGAARAAYNFSLEQIQARQEAYVQAQAGGVPESEWPRPLSAIDLQRAWYAARSERMPWHDQYPSRLYLHAFRAARAAHQAWMDGRAEFPRYKKKQMRASFTVHVGMRLEPGKLRLPLVGWVRIAAPDPAQADLRRLLRRKKARLASLTVSRDSAGSWWAALNYERTLTHTGTTAPESPSVVGVDLGVHTLAVAATRDGALVLRTDKKGALAAGGLKEVQRANRVVSRKDRTWQKKEEGRSRRSPSKRRAEAQKRLARIHRRQRWIREDRLHKLTRELAELRAVVVVEDLDVTAMAAKGGRRKAGLNRGLREAAFRELRRQLQYKLPEGSLLVSDRWFPSTKRCSRCGSKNTELTLRDRTWTCACGEKHDRDVNAATNLAAWGEAHLAEVGRIQDGDRQWAGPRAGPTQHARRGDDPTQHHRVPEQRDAATVGTRRRTEAGNSSGEGMDAPGQGAAEQDPRGPGRRTESHPLGTMSRDP